MTVIAPRLAVALWQLAASSHWKVEVWGKRGSELHFANDDDDVYYYIGERLKLEGETEKKGV